MERFATSVQKCLIALFIITPVLCFSQSNILENGSFEGINDNPLAGWTTQGGFIGSINELGAADGRNHFQVSPGGSFWRSIQTVPGRTYRVRFATVASGNTMQVRWDGQIAGTVVLQNVLFSPWIYTNFLVVALSNQSSLELVAVDGASALDDVSVGWMEEPPSITRAVPSRSTFDGGTVTFKVGVSGAPVLHYQWFKGGEPISGATNHLLRVDQVHKLDDGEYVVAISNAFGFVESLPATLLTHRFPNAPLITSQPKSQQLRTGYYGSVYTVAFGAGQLFYQWRLQGTNIPGATNASYIIPAVTAANAGVYSVIVSNHFGTVSSADATLEVQPGTGGGYVNWSNFEVFDGQPDAPIFDVDGVTPLQGSDYVAQLYSGPASNSLHSVGEPIEFLTDEMAGYYGGIVHAIPDLLAGQTAYVQVRAWDRSYGATFEEARARGGRAGASDVLSVVLSAPPAVPTPLLNLWRFSLQAGESLLATAKLYPGDKQPGGHREWLLIGDIGAQYVVERRTPPNNWEPFLLVTNETGTVSFVDPEAQNSSMNFYRARIVEP